MSLLATNNFGDTRSGGLAGPLALFIIVLLAVATILLIRNMNSRLRRLPDRFPAQPTSGSQQQPSEGFPDQAGARQDHSHRDLPYQGGASGDDGGEGRRGSANDAS